MKEDKLEILRNLHKEDILIVPYKWGIIFNWEGWNPLWRLGFKSKLKDKGEEDEKE